MPSNISYEYFKNKFANENYGITDLGGIYTKYINDTGSTSSIGTCVRISSNVDNGVSMFDSASRSRCIGVIAEDGIAVGQLVKVVISGIAKVKQQDSMGMNRGNVALLSSVQLGTVTDNSTNVTSQVTLGFFTENSTSGTNKLCSVHIQRL